MSKGFWYALSAVGGLLVLGWAVEAVAWARDVIRNWFGVPPHPPRPDCRCGLCGESKAGRGRKAA